MGHQDRLQHRETISAGRRFLDSLFQEPLGHLPHRWHWWLLTLLLLAGLPRLAVAILSAPFLYNDSAGDRGTAWMFAHADLSGYEAIHTPGYPAFVALAAGSLKDVQIAQLLLGLLTTALLLFLLAIRLTASPAAAFVAGALYGLNIIQVQLESTIMSEAMATTLVVSAMFLGVSLILDATPYPRAKLLGLGLVLAAAVLTRSALAVIPIAAVPFMLPRRTSKMRVAAVDPLANCSCSRGLVCLQLCLGWLVLSYLGLGRRSLYACQGLRGRRTAAIRDDQPSQRGRETCERGSSARRMGKSPSRSPDGRAALCRRSRRSCSHCRFVRS